MGKQCIVIYSSQQCSRCHFVRHLLDIHNVDYEIISDKELIVNKGFEELPVLEVNDKAIEGFSLVLSWLRKNDYYKENMNESY